MRLRTTVIHLVILIIVTIDCKSLGVSENNVTKRDSDHQHALFPDWVPFKNKHGEELGEFLQVPTLTKKPKKRLALPLSFMLRSVAEPDPDYYFDKGLGENDGEEYFERREWTEGDRSLKADNSEQLVRHTDLSDIEGVVNIITKQNPLRTSTNKPKRHYNERIRKEPKLTKNEEDYLDDEDEKDKHQPGMTNEEKNESERNKALILESVDELKERHAQEQKVISEKIKEEAMHLEERNRDIVQPEQFDKYGLRLKNKPLDYDDYEGKYEDKYKIAPLRKTAMTRIPKTETTTSPGIMSTSATAITQTGRISVFRNPSIYMIYDEDTTTESTTQTSVITSAASSKVTLTPDHATTTVTTDTPSTKYHSRITTPLHSDDSKITTPLHSANLNRGARIALVPQDNELREGEPTLFFPKKIKRKNSHKSISEKTTPNKLKSDVSTNLTDAIGAGSETAPSATATAGDNTGPTGESGPSGLESNSGTEAEISHTVEANSSEETPASAHERPATPPYDAVPAPSDHHEKNKEDKNHQHERGGETEHHSEHFSEEGESGKKTYKGHHEDKKTEKGHHDKEDHLGKYSDHGGTDKEHHDEKKHYGAHHHEEHGKKHAEYEESGKHSKGHSTKGSHDIHKKEEYEKNVEFFEEEGDSAEEEKHGGHHQEQGHHKGGNYKKGNQHTGHHDGTKGDSGHFSKYGHALDHRGHGSAAGYDAHGKHSASKFGENGNKNGKKWIFHHGVPARNANLVVIDRRADQLYHGPQYFG